ncbi:MAG TPA: hypothetical protein VKD90_29350 [Gemmataceae bacterium]|nr:hypothetical protein [Gemmataceae bacterium]
MSSRAPRRPAATGPRSEDGGPGPGGPATRDARWGLKWALLGILAVVAWLLLCLALR